MKPLLTKALVPIVAGTVTVSAAVGGYTALKSEEGYRVIQVYDLVGEAVVDRPSVGSMSAYVNMNLLSGDSAYTGEDSYMYLNLDSEEYALVEPDSKIVLEASGEGDTSRTKIYLDDGAVTNRIDKVLSENESYEVETPNSTMSVRGTEFRVVVSYDEDGTSHTELEVYEGVVEVTLEYPDGTESDEKVLFSAGSHVKVWGTDVTSDYEYIDENASASTRTNGSGGDVIYEYGEDGELIDVTEAGYDHLSNNTLNFLSASIEEGGHALTISKEELDKLIEAGMKFEGPMPTPIPRVKNTTNNNLDNSSNDNGGTNQTMGNNNGTSDSLTPVNNANVSANSNNNMKNNLNNSNDDNSSSSSSGSDSGSSDSGASNTNSAPTPTPTPTPTGNNSDPAGGVPQNTIPSDTLDPNDAGAGSTVHNFYYNGELLMQAQDSSDVPRMGENGSWNRNDNGDYVWE